MFISTKRAVIIPQSEHTKVAASIALLWGNKKFEKPKIPRHSFVKGVLFHDRGYGDHDSYPVGSLTLQQRRETLRKGILLQTSDPVADIVSLHHIRRLIPKEMTDLFLLLDTKLSIAFKKTKIPQKDFIFADHITELADTIAFYFSFEKDIEGEEEIIFNHRSENTKKVRFSIKGNQITLHPWPLSVDHYEGFILEYKKEGYNQRLHPEIRPFILKKR